jgi:hypothetical protein
LGYWSFVADNQLPSVVADNQLPSVVADNQLPSVVADNQLPSIVADTNWFWLLSIIYNSWSEMWLESLMGIM